MKQHRYYAEHHDNSPDEHSEPASSATRNDPAHIGAQASSRHARGSRLPEFVQPGPQAGDLSSIRFLAPRKLRRLDLDGPCPLTLTVNGRAIGIVRPGENSFNPPVPLEPGDTLQLEAIDPEEAENADALSGWTPASPIKNESSARGGSHV
jgi:hypothetical protein